MSTFFPSLLSLVKMGRVWLRWQSGLSNEQRVVVSNPAPIYDIAVSLGETLKLNPMRLALLKWQQPLIGA